MGPGALCFVAGLVDGSTHELLAPVLDCRHGWGGAGLPLGLGLGGLD